MIRVYQLSRRAVVRRQRAVRSVSTERKDEWNSSRSPKDRSSRFSDSDFRGRASARGFPRNSREKSLDSSPGRVYDREKPAS